MAGIPYINSPPKRSFFSYNVTLKPLSFNVLAHVKPLGPEPIIATFILFLSIFVFALIQPFSKALSIKNNSLALIPTALESMELVQHSSHRAGHT